MNRDEVIQAIEAILKRGNNAEVRRKGDGVIVLEVQKKIKYQSWQQEARAKPKEWMTLLI